MSQTPGPYGPYQPGAQSTPGQPGLPFSPGRPDGAPPAAPRPTVGPPSARPPGKRPMWMVWALLALIVVLLIVGGVLFFALRGPDRSTPESTGQDLVQGINDRNIDDVKDLFCPDDLRNAQDLQFTAQSRADKTFGAKFIRIDRANGKTNAIIDMTQAGNTATGAWPMRQSDGQWEFCGTPTQARR